MAETPKLSVEKALNKLRTETPKSRDTRLTEEIDALEAETKRLKAQRLRLKPLQPRSTRRD